MSTQPHSAEQFGPQRDFWWNRDFLDLMAKRWRLSEAASLADIGCGLCHWSRLLYPYLRAPARFAGVDREARWVAEAPQHFRRVFPETAPELLSFHEGDATRIPLPDNSFEVVTCQTVLMHLAEPIEALQQQSEDSTTGRWNREDLRRLFLLGGGKEELFERAFVDLLDRFTREQQAIANGTFHAAHGNITYLVSGRKKSPKVDTART